MTKIKITTDNYGRLSLDSRHQIRSLIESRGGLIGKHLAKVALPQIESAIQRNVAAPPRPIRIMRAAYSHTKSAGSPQFSPANGFATLLLGLVMRPVTSSSLRRVGYVPVSRMLRIEFIDGSVWDYLRVPSSEYAGLMNTGSHGKYFHAHIKGRYFCRKVAR